MNTNEYKKYRIDKYTYRELMYLCLQYNDMRTRVSDCYGVKAVSYEPSGSGNAPGNPVQATAERIEKLSSDINYIDRALELTAEEPLRGIIKQSVTLGMKYEDLFSVPCGRRQFYELRRKFFYNLKFLKKG